MAHGLVLSVVERMEMRMMRRSRKDAAAGGRIKASRKHQRSVRRIQASRQF